MPCVCRQFHKVKVIVLGKYVNYPVFVAFHGTLWYNYLYVLSKYLLESGVDGE